MRQIFRAQRVSRLRNPRHLFGPSLRGPRCGSSEGCFLTRVAGAPSQGRCGLRSLLTHSSIGTIGVVALFSACQSHKASGLDQTQVTVTLEKPRVMLDDPDRAGILQINLVLDEEGRAQLGSELRGPLVSALQEFGLFVATDNVLPGGTRLDWAAKERRTLQALVEASGTQAVVHVGVGWSSQRYWIRVLLYDPRQDRDLWACVASLRAEESDVGPIQAWPSSSNEALCRRALAALRGEEVVEETELAFVTVVRESGAPSKSWTFALTRSLDEQDLWFLWLLGPHIIFPAAMLAADIVFLPIAIFHDLVFLE